MSVAAPPRARTAVLVGNPNVGKSSLFNALTGLRVRVANYAGVTVDALEGDVALAAGPVRLVDLPGTYSLVPGAADEAIVERVLLGHGAPPPDVVLVVLEATNLRRNLFLLGEALDLGRPTVVALNMVDEARRAGLDVPTRRLAELTGVEVVETVATTGEGLDALKAALDRARPPADRAWRFAEADLEARLAATPGPNAWERLAGLRQADPAVRPAEVSARYAWINEALGAAPSGSARARTDRIDAALLHPLLGPLFFLGIMAVVFQAVFAGARPLMEAIEAAKGWLQELAGAHLPAVLGELGASLVRDGVLGGVGAVLVFLPQILVLFLFLGLLEDTGYMARAAFLVDRPLRALGLSGRSFIPLLSSFACAIPGVLATRTIPGRSERLLAVFLAPLMTCSARLPVYALLIAAFVPATTVLGPLGLQGLLLLGLYLAGMTAAALLALVISRRRTGRGKELPLVVELPPYRRPGLRAVLLKLRVRGGDFVKRAGTTIFVVTLALWALSTFPRVEPPADLGAEEAAAHRRRESWAGQLGRGLEPVLHPLGYDWKIGVGLIASFAAREVFVGTMGVVYSVGEDLEGEEQERRLRERLQAAVHEDGPRRGQKVFTLPVVASLLVFYVFALQCGATVAVVRREAGSWRFALGQLALFGALAYVGALVTYQGLTALGV
ncbi:MAG: ferrous iron transport protein B [Planctomycetes bacterium]|nr:ferrous iron transport protein B [Planctomycetota bacterium]